MRQIGIGIIGCGSRINGVLRQILPNSKNLKVVALFDPGAGRTDLFRREFNPEAKVYGDYRKLAADKDVDWVVVGSWNCYHHDHVLAAFKAGKHVFCEKPLATNLEDCVDMVKAWKKSGKRFSIGFTLRYSPHYRKIHELISRGKIGRPISFEFNETLAFNHGGYIMADWRRQTKWAGTHLLEKCCHDIDLANWMVGAKAARVASFGGLDFFLPKNKKHQKRIGKNKDGVDAYMTWTVSRPKEYDNPFTSKKDIIDNQVAIIEYENGVRATFHTNCNSGIPERRMYVVGTEGALRADVISGSIELQRIGWDTKLENAFSGVKGGHGGGDTVLGKSVAESMLKGKAPFTGIEDGLLAAVTCFGIDEAMRKGQVVDMRPLWRRAGLE